MKTEETPQQIIIGRELQHLSEGADVQMVPVQYLRRHVCRKQQIIHAPELLPTN